MSIESPDSNPIESNPADDSSTAVEDTNVTDSQASSLDVAPETTATEVTGETPAVDGESSEEPEKITDPKLMDRFECRSCGYIYEPVKGDDSTGIDAGTPFEEIYASWKCPVCTAPKRRFSNVGPAGNPSGFKENLGYGLGVNVMTPGQKNILIFGSLFLGFLFFLSLYGLK